MKNVTIIGIVDNILYLAPLYGGDSYHHFIIPSSIEKMNLIDAGVKEYSSIDYIEAYCHGMTYEEYLVILEECENSSDVEITSHNHKDGLPF